MWKDFIRCFQLGEGSSRSIPCDCENQWIIAALVNIFIQEPHTYLHGAGGQQIQAQLFWNKTKEDDVYIGYFAISMLTRSSLQKNGADCGMKCSSTKMLVLTACCCCLVGTRVGLNITQLKTISLSWLFISEFDTRGWILWKSHRKLWIWHSPHHHWWIYEYFYTSWSSAPPPVLFDVRQKATN